MSAAAVRAAEIFGPLDVDKDGEITMDEFVDGYMKIHTLSNGKRRWSRKASMFQTVSEEDLEKLRNKMDTVMLKADDKKDTNNSKESKENNKTVTEKNTKENKENTKAASAQNTNEKGTAKIEENNEKGKIERKNSVKKSKK